MFFKQKMNIEDDFLNANPYFPARVKRKRYSNYNKNINSEDEDGSDVTDDMDSLSSSSSVSYVSTGSSRISLKRHGHKVLVADEKVTDATDNLNNLQLEIEMENIQTSPISSLDLDIEKPVFDLNSDEEEDEQVGEEETCLVISDVLQSHLKKLNNEAYLFSQIKNETDLNKLQIIPWTPNVNASKEKKYNVEEPNEYKKNKLKRKLSQMNRIHIEELNSNENLFSMPPYTSFHTMSNSLSNFYLVEHSDDFKKDDLQKKHLHLNITEIKNESSSDEKLPSGDEERMEF